MDKLTKDELIKFRTPLRSNFTRSANQVEEILGSKPVDLEEINVSISLLSDKFSKLEAADNQMLQLLSKDSTVEPEDLEVEYEKITSYCDIFVSLRTKVERLQKSSLSNQLSAHASTDNGLDDVYNKRTVKLPKIELPKYDGAIKGWIGFWSLFKKIDEDPDLSDGDKFMYLIQSTAEGSRARELVESYPPTDVNYPLAKECLKSRFGKDELLIEVYVRELLTLVLNHNKCSLVTLYDKIEAYLRALGTLGVTSDKYAAMLYPLVESCLPEDILKIWERHISSVIAASKEKTEINKLTVLMEFLGSEVEGEQRLAIAKNSFDYGKETHKKSFKRCVSENNCHVPTASGLLNTNDNNENFCIFCFKKHNSADCNKAKIMTLDERRDILKKAACCFRCLRKGHLSKHCRSKIKCFSCNQYHCTIMCSNTTRGSSIGTPKFTEELNSVPNKDQVLSNQSTEGNVLLQTLQVYIRGKHTRQVIRAIIDTGSQHSYISSKAAEMMKYECVREVPIIHSLFGGKETPQQVHHCFRVYLTSMDESYNCNFEALEQEKICGDITKIPTGPWMKDLRKRDIHLTDVTSSSCEVDAEIHLLIGADVAGKLLNGKIHNLNDGPVAVGTQLGWTLMGKIPQKSQTSESCLSIICLHTRDINLPDLWSLDRIGIMEPAEQQTEIELHKAAYEHFQSNLKVNEEGRYEVKLPWLQFHPDLTEGREIAERRLKTTITKLKAANILEPYQNVLHTWLKEGIIEEVNFENSSSPGHFLPHRAVVKNSATTKIRPVFDASAHTRGSPSLNECLVKGPNFLELIPTILTRFRLKQFAVTADIKQAFLQISVFERDRNYLKFLWMEDGDATKLKTYRHCRVVFGLTCSPFLLNATLKHHLESAPPRFRDTALKLIDSFYVDNCLAGFDTVEDCELFIGKARELLQKGKFDLRGWKRNYCIPETDQVPNVTNEPEEEGDLLSVLGLTWDLSKDVLYCNTSYFEMENSQPVTKRKILATAQQIFDPLGMICPFTLLPKLLLQECWKLNIPWDKELPDDISKTFLNWKKQIAFLKDISIPRWLLKTELPLRYISLHVFADASKCAYAVCIFVRIETEESVSCEFVSAKNRVCPLKPITIPRLELLACLIAARLAENVKKEIQRPDIETHYWTDSSNALSWIKNEDCWATFVANRAKEIRNLSHPNDWHHLPGRYNPADIPSRGSTIKHLIETKWLHGPEWLKASREEWPKSSIVVDEDILNQERRKTVVTNTEKEVPWYHNRLSSYSKLTRTIAWMKRFCTNAKKIKPERNFLPLAVAEIEHAELMLLRSIQQEAFISISNPILKPLQPQLDDKGLIRVTTRLIQREDTENFKRPIVLPSTHPVVHLLIMEHHRRGQHAGVHTLMAQLRENFWILQCRRTVRKVLRKCKNCQRFEAPKAEVIPAPLPEKRIRDAATFEITGIDLGGPLYLKNGEKVWFVLFTCAVIRAVHIELVLSLSTETFLLAFRRFVSRRGRPLYVYSDNGTNFTGANNIFESIDWQKVEEMASVQRIQWIFIPPSAPWWGGWWERIVGIIKRILRRVLGRARLNYEELYTTICEAEYIVNSRPLTYLSEDIEDLQPLTPSLFLQEIRCGSVPELDTFDSAHLNKRLRYRQKLKEDLMKRFRLEYLGQLKNSKLKSPTTLKVGQVVLVGSDNLKRIDWPMAKVLEIYLGKDKNPRVARVKTANGELVRPYQRLYPLEANEEERPTLIETLIPPDCPNQVPSDGPLPPPDCPNQVPSDGPLPPPDSPSLVPRSDPLPPPHCPNQITRGGRVVKPVKRLDLLTLHR